MIFSAVGFPWIFLLALLVSGNGSEAINYATFDFAAGLAGQLQCNDGVGIQNVNVTWTSRFPTQSLENVPGISVKGNVLWFLPAQLLHSGSYSCLSRENNDTWETIFNVSVHSETCPRRNRIEHVTGAKEIKCFLPHVFKLNPEAQVTWRKNCQPVEGAHGKLFPINRSNVGLFTCFVNFTFEGRNFTSAQTTEIYNKTEVVTRPEIVFPNSETIKVTLGERYELKCKALVGQNDNRETDLYWIPPENLEFLNENLTRLKEGDRDYLMSVLEIPEVTDEHLYTNFTCTVLHSAGQDFRIVVLIPADRPLLIVWLALGLLALLLLLAGLVFLFRVDLVLAYRDVFSRAACSDGKSYDAYVTYLHGDQLSSSSAVTFALRFLPATLEDLHGYKLFISGRDELPGEAIHDVVAERMSRSRRLIVVLTSQRPTSGSDSSSVAAYEQRVGLYSALVERGLKVILVQVEDELDPTLLPESLRFIHRTAGVLRWRPDGTRRARFWKHLRYRMPPRPRRKRSQINMLL